MALRVARHREPPPSWRCARAQDGESPSRPFLLASRTRRFPLRHGEGAAPLTPLPYVAPDEEGWRGRFSQPYVFFRKASLIQSSSATAAPRMRISNAAAQRGCR
jgi:hypothetical protein